MYPQNQIKLLDHQLKILKQLIVTLCSTNSSSQTTLFLLSLIWNRSHKNRQTVMVIREVYYKFMSKILK